MRPKIVWNIIRGDERGSERIREEMKIDQVGLEQNNWKFVWTKQREDHYTYKVKTYTSLQPMKNCHFWLYTTPYVNSLVAYSITLQPSITLHTKYAVSYNFFHVILRFC